MTGQLRTEFRKIASTRLWWVLLIPVALLAVLINLFAGVFTLALDVDPDGEQRLPLLLASLAYTLTLTATFAALHGAIATAGEFRHRTITTTYLASSGRTPVLLAKLGGSAAVGAGYAVVASVFGVLAALLAQGDSRMPEFASVLAVVGTGMAVAALWGALGVALGTVLGNQAGVLVALLVYVLLGEVLLAALLGASDVRPIAQFTAYLPVNAGEAALYDVPAQVLLGPEQAPELVGAVAGITDPLPWWGSLLVLAAWATGLAALAGWTGARRDIT